MGVLLTMYDGRNNAAKTIRNVAIGTFGEEMVFRTTIPRSYRELAQEMEARLDPKNA